MYVTRRFRQNKSSEESYFSEEVDEEVVTKEEEVKLPKKVKKEKEIEKIEELRKPPNFLFNEGERQLAKNGALVTTSDDPLCYQDPLNQPCRFIPYNYLKDHIYSLDKIFPM